MVAAGARIPCSQDDVAGQLLLDVHVKLLHHALLEVQVLVETRALEGIRIQWRRDEWQKRRANSATLT